MTKIDGMKCDVCDGKAVGYNFFGAFCNHPEHYQVSAEFKEKSRRMDDTHRKREPASTAGNS